MIRLGIANAAPPEESWRFDSDDESDAYFKNECVTSRVTELDVESWADPVIEGIRSNFALVVLTSRPKSMRHVLIRVSKLSEVSGMGQSPQLSAFSPGWF